MWNTFFSFFFFKQSWPISVCDPKSDAGQMVCFVTSVWTVRLRFIHLNGINNDTTCQTEVMEEVFSRRTLRTVHPYTPVCTRSSYCSTNDMVYEFTLSPHPSSHYQALITAFPLHICLEKTLQSPCLLSQIHHTTRDVIVFKWTWLHWSQITMENNKACILKKKKKHKKPHKDLDQANI